MEGTLTFSLRHASSAECLPGGPFTSPLPRYCRDTDIVILLLVAIVTVLLLVAIVTVLLLVAVVTVLLYMFSIEHFSNMSCML